MDDLYPYQGNLSWLRPRTILLVTHGSRAYGLSTPTSDTDIKGVAIPPREYFLGFSKRFEQAETHEPDMVVYEVRKFFSLAADCNPNIIEVLWVDPSDIRVQTKQGQKLLEARELFLSKKARFTFSGYAHAQLKRINTHYRWLKTPPGAPPTRAELGLPERTLIPADQLEAAQAAIRKKLDQWNPTFLDELDSSVRIGVLGRMTEYLADIQVNADTQWIAAARSIGYDENFIRLLDLEKRYEARKKEWDQYQEWKATRNPARAAIEQKYGYDCYADDTEFLTADGWKRFDDVTETDKLATVFVRRGVDESASMSHRPLLGVEYQEPTHRFDAIYNGPMFRVSGQHTDSFVTANHRMLFQKVERKSGVKYGWTLEQASFLPDTFEVLVAPEPRTKTYSNKDLFVDLPIPPQAYLTLMGWYLSDGSAALVGEGQNVRVRGIRISQELGGKRSWHMARWHTDHGEKASSSLYQYTRPPNAYNPRDHEERVLDVRHPEVAGRMVAECGFKDAKRIPRYVFSLSRRLMEHLLVGLLRGDGTKREHKTKPDSFIYYTTSKELANDVQELALMAGWETALWGPFSNEDRNSRAFSIYQVHLRRSAGQTRQLIRCQNVEQVEVSGQRIVCFSVPNGTLITRRNGKVAIHGNCKHASHLVRLMRMCREILTTGQVIVKRPDREELLAIKQGAWSYEQLIEWASQQEAEMESLYRASPLRKTPDRDKLDALCQELVESMLSSDAAPL